MHESKWILKTFKNAPQKTEYPLQEKMGRHKIYLDVTPKDGETGGFRCSMHVDSHNTINFDVALSAGKSNLLQADVGTVAATRMATSPEVKETETALEDAL